MTTTTKRRGRSRFEGPGGWTFACETCFDTLTIDSGGKVVRCPDCKPECVANSDTSKGPEVPFYYCPCAECTRMEWKLGIEMDGPTGSLREFRISSFPEYWPDLEDTA